MYLSYWCFEDPLFKASCIPTIRYLQKRYGNANVFIYTLESARLNHTESNHFYSRIGGNFVSKITTLCLAVFSFSRVLIKAKVDLVIARTSLAGNIALTSSVLTRIPFIVESFEPHAQYMSSNGVWPRFGLKYLVSRCLEYIQLNRARALITVSHHYKRSLSRHSEVYCIPSVVLIENFEFSAIVRDQMRKRLSIEDRKVGIYVGKFRDIYWDPDRFIKLAKKIKNSEPRFFMIILSQNYVEIRVKLQKEGFTQEDFYTSVVPNREVANYLSAADFAFSLINSTPFTFACSPIKNGEFWANGLPTILPEHIGDDSSLVIEYEAGILFDEDDFFSYESFLKILRSNANRQSNRCVELASKHRSMRLLEECYQLVLSE